MSTRIYLVTDVETNKHRLIRAGNQAQAIRHAAIDDADSARRHGFQEPTQRAGRCPSTARLVCQRGHEFSKE